MTCPPAFHPGNLLVKRNMNSTKLNFITGLKHDMSLFLGGGGEFNLAFSLTGYLRSIIPEKINILALTETATQEV